jgi:hypothetical protein
MPLHVAESEAVVEDNAGVYPAIPFLDASVYRDLLNPFSEEFFKLFGIKQLTVSADDSHCYVVCVQVLHVINDLMQDLSLVIRIHFVVVDEGAGELSDYSFIM